jgi:ADP-heptose:LPS heptosyltransferase
MPTLKLKSPVIAVLRFSSIGDVLMTTPAVRALKQQLGAKIIYCTKAEMLPLLAGNPYIDEVLLLDSSLVKLCLQLVARRVTHIVDLHSNLRSHIVCGLLAYTDQLRVQKGANDRNRLIADKTFHPAPLHMADRHLAALAPWGIQPDSLGLDFVIPKQDNITYNRIVFVGTTPFVAIVLGGQHATKRLPEAKLLELIRTINYPIVLLGGHAERETGARAAGTLAMEGRWDIYNACGELSLGQSGSVLAQSEYVISNDTGLMHMAAALQKKAFVIWGATVPAFGMYPYGTQFSNYKVEGLDCQPCHRHGSESCPKGHFKCMVDQVFSHNLPQFTTQDPDTRERMVS